MTHQQAQASASSGIQQRGNVQALVSIFSGVHPQIQIQSSGKLGVQQIQAPAPSNPSNSCGSFLPSDIISGTE